MHGAADNAGPSYISSHSADVILSEIRPIKLKIEALRSINVLLDEFLYSILNTACSLSTDKLRASLLNLLPTTLGKEALLEAEVELRAYWDRTGPVDATTASVEDDAKTFHLQWAFELLRLKCEAYSTLNESDEDAGAEERINTGMTSSGAAPPKPTLMAPAALYLTAILEALCEHILSNVGRVASRDSSRNSATAQDLFVALCEDHSIYSLFKTMKVYEQIEQLSKAPRVRRSKSFTRNDKIARTSSPHQDLSAAKDGSTARSRLSSEGPGMTTTPANPGSRSSFDKTRAMKMFMANSKSSADRDENHQNGHKKSDSTLSESSRHTATQLIDDGSTFEDEAMQQEFDDLMRSSSTMKVSLTPDRLKTMEPKKVHKQEKDQRGNRRPVPISFKSESESSVPPRATGRRPSLLRVESIKEDEEESPTTRSTPPLPTRSRQASVSSPPTSAPPGSRARSISTSGATAASRVPTKLSLSNTPPAVPSKPDSKAMQHRRVPQGQDPFPPRTRRIQHNRESIDLDDIEGGSDDDEFVPAAKVKVTKTATTPNRPSQPAVSAGTRDLMDFLAQGPPDLGGNASDAHQDGLSGYNPGSENGKPKGTGRLQRMISKLSLGNAEKSRDDFSKSKPPPTPVRQTVPSKPSAGNLSSLANRPIPPRPPRPISPPASPSHDFSEDQSYHSRPRVPSVVHHKRKSIDAQPIDTAPLPPQRDHSGSISSTRRQNPQSSNGHGHGNRNGRTEGSSATSPTRSVHTTPKNDIPIPPPTHEQPISPARTPQASPIIPQTRKPIPIYVASTSKPHISGTDAQDLHRLLSQATNADECRLIFDMFLAKSGIPVEPTSYDIPYPSPSPSVVARMQDTPADVALEHSLVELFLGSDQAIEPAARKRWTKKKSKPEVVAAEQLPPRSTHGERKVRNGGSQVGNGKGTHHNGNGSPSDPQDTAASLSRPTQNYTPVSQVGA